MSRVLRCCAGLATATLSAALLFGCPGSSSPWLKDESGYCSDSKRDCTKGCTLQYSASSERAVMGMMTQSPSTGIGLSGSEPCFASCKAAYQSCVEQNQKPLIQDEQNKQDEQDEQDEQIDP